VWQGTRSTRALCTAEAGAVLTATPAPVDSEQALSCPKPLGWPFLAFLITADFKAFFEQFFK